MTNEQVLQKAREYSSLKLDFSYSAEARAAYAALETLAWKQLERQYRTRLLAECEIGQAHT